MPDSLGLGAYDVSWDVGIRHKLLVMKGDVAMTIADSLSTYTSAEAVGKTLHALPTDTVLHTEADFDDFKREMLDDD